MPPRRRTQKTDDSQASDEGTTEEPVAETAEEEEMPVENEESTEDMASSDKMADEETTVPAEEETAAVEPQPEVKAEPAEVVENGHETTPPKEPVTKPEPKKYERRDPLFPLFIPSLDEFHKDMNFHYDSKTLMVGPVQLSDLSNEKLFGVMQEADFFQIKFAKVEDGSFQGYVEMIYSSEEAADACTQEIGELSDAGIIVKHLKQTAEGSVDCEDIKSTTNAFQQIENTASAAEKLIVVSQLSDEITEEKIREALPEAKTIVFPMSHLTNERKRYCYVELPSKDAVNQQNGKSVTFDDHSCKTKKIEDLPRVEYVLKQLKTYENVLQAKDPIIDDTDKLNDLHRYGTHYERSEYVDEDTKGQLSSILELVRKKTKGKAKNMQSMRGMKRPYGGDSRASLMDLPKQRRMGYGGGGYRDDGWNNSGYSRMGWNDSWQQSNYGGGGYRSFRGGRNQGW